MAALLLISLQAKSRRQRRKNFQKGVKYFDGQGARLTEDRCWNYEEKGLYEEEKKISSE